MNSLLLIYDCYYCYWCLLAGWKAMRKRQSSALRACVCVCVFISSMKWDPYERTSNFAVAVTINRNCCYHPLIRSISFLLLLFQRKWRFIFVVSIIIVSVCHWISKLISRYSFCLVIFSLDELRDTISNKIQKSVKPKSNSRKRIHWCDFTTRTTPDQLDLLFVLEFASSRNISFKFALYHSQWQWQWFGDGGGATD